MRRLAVGSDLYLDSDESAVQYPNNIGNAAFGNARTIYVLRAVIRGAVVDSVCCAPANVDDVVYDRIGKSVCSFIGERRHRQCRRRNVGVFRRVVNLCELA